MANARGDASLRVKPQTRKRLKIYAAYEDATVDEAINKLLDIKEATNSGTPISSGSGGSIGPIYRGSKN